MPEEQQGKNKAGEASASAESEQLSHAELEEIRKDLIQYNTTTLKMDNKLAARSANIFVRELKRAAV